MLAGGRRDGCDRRTRKRGDVEQHLPDNRAERLETGCRQGAQGRRHGQGIAGTKLASLEGTDELEREERIPTRRLVDADERGACHLRAHAASDDLVQCTDRERADDHPLVIPQRVGTGAAGGQERHLVAVEAAEGVRQRLP